MVQHLKKYSTSYINNSSMYNDNSNSKKYSLRQRQRDRKPIAYQIPNQTPKHQQINKINKITSNGSLTLRSIRMEATSQTVNKLKSKAAPLSKYRRKTANARERSRMREINLAFENLRQCVPPVIDEEDVGCTNEKLTKITTLRLAMKYISKLTEVLADPNFDVDFLIENKKNYAGDNIKKNCSSARQNNQHRLNAIKPQANKSKFHSKNNKRKIYNFLGAHNRSSMHTAESSINAADSLFPFNFGSDGESIHLSETCMTENSEDLNHEYESSQSVMNFAHDSIEIDCLPLEISLCILDESFANDNLILDQQPLSCSSPFVAMDPFNPFNDLLHHEFSEHNSLDLFLT